MSNLELRLPWVRVGWVLGGVMLTTGGRIVLVQKLTCPLGHPRVEKKIGDELGRIWFSQT